MKLELKHIAPYLPYNLKLKYVSKYDVDKLSIESIVTLKQINEGSICVNGYKTNNKSYMPILHPLSDLTKEIEVNGEKFIPIKKLAEFLHEDECDSFDSVKSAELWIGMIMDGTGLLALPFKVIGKLIG